jgi:hypothetical protein
MHIKINYNMKTSLHLLFIFFVLSSVKVFAQDDLAMAFPKEVVRTSSSSTGLPVFEFKVYSNENDLSTISKDMVEAHIFGELVSKKLYLLDSKYTYKVPMVPGNPQMRTIVRKPVIYDAVMKIERYLKKSVKKGEISMETASADFNKVLDVANSICTADTKSFEKEISSTNDVVSLVNLLTKRVNLVL